MMYRLLLSVVCFVVLLNEATAERELSDVSETFIRKINNYFRVTDVNQDGVITIDDIHKIIDRYALVTKMDKAEQDKLHSDTVPKMWNLITRANITQDDNDLTHESVLSSIIMSRNSEDLKDVIRDSSRLGFEVMDRDHNGVLSRSEHENVFRAVKFSKGVIRLSFASYDVNHDREISLDEFISRHVSFMTSDDVECSSKYILGPLD